MATMFPEELQQDDFETTGEGQVYTFLQHHAKPDHEFLVWYEPRIGHLKPDFVVYHPSIGLLILEVKDWMLGQIVDANPHRFTLRHGRQDTPASNPLGQSTNYVTALMQMLRSDGQLVSEDPAHNGQPRIPIVGGVVFTNIRSSEYTEQNLNTVIPRNLVLLEDDLSPYSPFSSDPTGRFFREAMAQRFPPRFRFALSPADQKHLRLLLFPHVRLRPVRRSFADDTSEQDALIAVLDRHQEDLARQTLSGHHLLHGHSGTGKTLVLVHKAALLLRYQPAVRRILFCCYNLSLVRYIERLLADLRVPLGNPGVEVLPFYTLCGRLADETVEQDVADGADYYQILLDDALAKVQQTEPGQRYDAILVDEGQDFSDSMLKVLVGLLEPRSNRLTIALDGNQNLYGHERNWQALGIHVRGRARQLRTAYRATEQLNRFSAHLIGLTPEEATPQLELFPPTPALTGPAPDLCAFGSLPDLLTGMQLRIRAWIDDGRHPNEIAVLYLSRRLPGHTDELPNAIEQALRQSGIHCQWLSRDVASKERYDITTDAVTISTVHSVKGLDYARVFLLGLDREPDTRWTAQALTRLAYVGATRARRELVIPYLTRTALIERLEQAREAAPG